MNIELIHTYIEGRLKDEELLEFERKLADDVELRTEVKLQREILTHLSLVNSTSDARSAISEVHNEYSSELIEGHSKRWFWVGGIFVVMLLLLLLFRMLNGTGSKDDHVLQFATLPEASFMTKGSSADDLSMNASMAYNNKEYATAIQLFDQALDIGSSIDGELEFYKGLSLLGLMRYDEAIVSFSNLKEEHPLFTKDADWYMAMSYWYRGDRNKAGEILRSFTSGNYQKKAQAYLQSME